MQAPMVKGHGRTSLEDDVACVLQQLSLESFDCEHLSRTLDEYMGFTTDFGVEVKVADGYYDRSQPWLHMPMFLSDRIARSPAPIGGSSDPVRRGLQC